MIKKKIFIITLLFSFSFSQHLGMLKTNKNKTGLGMFARANYMYNIDDEGDIIVLKPGDYSYHFYYRSKLNFEIYASTTPKQVDLEEAQIFDEYNIGIAYHFHQKNWGVGLGVNKILFDNNELLENTLLKQKSRTGLIVSFYAKKIFSPIIPFISFSNMYYDNPEDIDILDDTDSFTFGAIYENSNYLVLWGWTTLIGDDWHFDINYTYWYVGLGIEIL